MMKLVREVFIEIYLILFGVVFVICKAFPLKNKVVFVTSFKENNLAIYHEMERVQFPSSIIFLSTKRVYQSIKSEVNVPVYPIETKNPFKMIVSIYHLATARKIIVDNYYGFLAATNFKPEVECIQVWHAAGAIKTFGMKDKSIEGRTKRAKKRFKKVYSKFHKVVAGSDYFGHIFQEAFDLKEENILKTGIPRTDLFFDQEKHEQIKKNFFKQYPELQGKKLILYAPTYRDQGMDQAFALNIDELYNKFKDEYVLIVRLHPSVMMNLDLKYEGFVYDFSKYPNINDLLIVVDLLITDYSSIPFEFAMLNKPMIFYAYDLEQYLEGRGLWESYDSMVPGPIVKTTKEIATTILNHEFDFQKIYAFNQKWNQYSNGEAAKNLVHYISSFEGSRDVDITKDVSK